MNVISFSCIGFFPGAGSKRQTRWHDVNIGDMKVFFALHIAMGLVHKPALKNYWTTELCMQTPFFNEYMSLNTFELISQNLHFHNDTNNPPISDPAHDPLGKIRNVIDKLQVTFRESLCPKKELGLDEAMCAFHGVCKFRAFNPNKPDKYHLKLYAVAESQSGYILGFEVATGKEKTRGGTVTWPSVQSLMQKRFSVPQNSILKFGACPTLQGTEVKGITSIVMQMMHKYELLDQGYHLYTDNFYSSPALATALMRRNTAFCGTVRPNKIGWPVALKKASAKRTSQQHPIIKKLSQDIAWHRSKDDECLAMCVGDRKVFHLLSTIHRATQAWIYVPSENRWVWRPTAVMDYNYGMKAVDLGDKILKSYEMNRKTLLWTNKLVFHLVNMAAMNAFILYRRSNAGNLTHEQFRSAVISGLVQEGNTQRNYSIPCMRPLSVAPECRFHERHFPEAIPVKPGSRAHRTCTGCYQKPGKNTKVQCRACKRFLCAWPCFKVWHTKDLTHVQEMQAQTKLIEGLRDETKTADPTPRDKQ